ncbi:phospho-sugar glycosidase domain-containing protein, partial [Streptococcus pyogenes]
VFNAVDIKRGDITIGNDEAGQYRGELQLALQDRPNLGSRQNVIGHVRKADLILLDLIQPWQSFKFLETK